MKTAKSINRLRSILLHDYGLVVSSAEAVEIKNQLIAFYEGLLNFNDNVGVK